MAFWPLSSKRQHISELMMPPHYLLMSRLKVLFFFSFALRKLPVHPRISPCRISRRTCMTFYLTSPLTAGSKCRSEAGQFQT